MSHRLSTAIKIGDYASSILRQVEGFQKDELLARNDEETRVHIGIEPMLLALSMEFALKAWYVFDYDDPNVKREHNLLKLFEALKEESKERLDREFKHSVAPRHPNFLCIDYGIRDVLNHHADAFVEWRYLHERKRTLNFNLSTFTATLEMVLDEFRKRYRTETVQPIWNVNLGNKRT